ncbi:winged helix-turn-helix domain-containing protein [Pseudomonas cerasi]
MLSAEECKALLDCDILFFEDCLILDCNINKLEAPALNMTIMLSESQKRLMVCLLKKINCKRKIINIVWYENHQRISDNNYHQLTFQLRASFQKNNLPDNLLITVPYYGIKLNENICRTLTMKNLTETEEEETTKEIKIPDRAQINTTPTDKNNVMFMFSFMVMSLFILWLE